MSTRKRALLISCSIILLCVTIIAGMTYSLFTENVSVKNHLKAGDLDLKLTRTKLTYAILDGDGYLETHGNDKRVELTNTTLGSLNIFGLDSTNMRIVPGSYFEAELEIDNVGEVAFVYNVDLAISGMTTNLARQLMVTVTDSDGNAHSDFLSDFSEEDGYLIASVREMSVTAPIETFTVRVEFINDVDFNANLAAGETFMDNDLAQMETATFDLIVSATQKTDRP